MSSSTAKTQASNEEVLNQKLDVCLSNALVKTGLGFVAGTALSLVLFKRRAYPIWLSTGFGIGSGYSDCQRLYTPLTLPGVRVLPSSSSSSSSSSASIPATQPGLLEKISDRAGEAIASGRKDLEPKLKHARDVVSVQADKVKEDVVAKAKDVVEAAQDKAVELKDKAVGGAKEVKDKTTAMVTTSQVQTTRIASMLEPIPSLSSFLPMLSIPNMVWGIATASATASASASLLSRSQAQLQADPTLQRQRLQSDPETQAQGQGKGQVQQDCLACRLTGTLTMMGLGSYSFLEAYRAGAFSSSSSPSSSSSSSNSPPKTNQSVNSSAASSAGAKAKYLKPQPVRGPFLVLFGLAAWAGGAYRWIM